MFFFFSFSFSLRSNNPPGVQGPLPARVHKVQAAEQVVLQVALERLDIDEQRHREARLDGLAAPRAFQRLREVSVPNHHQPSLLLLLLCCLFSSRITDTQYIATRCCLGASFISLVYIYMTYIGRFARCEHGQTKARRE